MKERLALIVAVVVVIAYGALVFVLWQVVGDEEIVWGRRLVLFGGVEALVFAAVGWLFGREVNRGAAEQAKDATEQARKESEERGVVEGKAAALAAAVRSSGGTEGFETAPAEVQALRILVDELFPAPPAAP